MRLRQIREANDRFHSRVSFSPTALILRHPEIYIPLANFIINYRVVTWHHGEISRADVIEVLKQDYLRPILAHARKSNLGKEDMQSLFKMVLHLVSLITKDSEHNTVWTTAFLVQLYEGRSMLNFLTHENPFIAMHGLWMHVFNGDLRIKNQRLPPSQRPSISQVLQKEFQMIKHKDNSFLQSREKFLDYMPPFCRKKQDYHSWIQLIFLFALSLGILFLFGKSGFYLALPLLFPIIYIPFEKVSNLKIIYRDPFTFSYMTNSEKTGLLTEIARSLSIKREVKHAAVVKSSTGPGFHTETDAHQLYYPPSDHPSNPKKFKPRKSPTADEAMDEKQCVDTLLANAQLAPPIILVWDTIQWGVITAQVGMTQKDLYPLWSGHFSQYGFYYVYFPEQELQQHEDQGMLNECKDVLAIGHVVPPTGHVGIVRETKDTLKIKMLSSGKGIQATGKPSEWRFSLFCLTHPQHLNAPPPRVGEHQYQLYAPNHLSKTH